MTYFFNKKWSKKVDFLKPAVIKRRAWKTLNIVSTLAIVLNTGLIGGLIKPATAQANPPPGWDKSSLSFNDDYGCHTGNVSGTTELANAHRVSPGESGTITLNVKVKNNIACNVTEIPNKAKI